MEVLLAIALLTYGGTVVAQGEVLPLLSESFEGGLRNWTIQNLGSGVRGAVQWNLTTNLAYDGGDNHFISWYEDVYNATADPTELALSRIMSDLIRLPASFGDANNTSLQLRFDYSYSTDSNGQTFAVELWQDGVVGYQILVEDLPSAGSGSEKPYPIHKSFAIDFDAPATEFRVAFVHSDSFTTIGPRFGTLDNVVIVGETPATGPPSCFTLQNPPAESRRTTSPCLPLMWSDPSLHKDHTVRIYLNRTNGDANEVILNGVVSTRTGYTLHLEPNGDYSVVVVPFNSYGEAQNCPATAFYTTRGRLLFHEDFEQGLGQWNATVLAGSANNTWRLTSSPSYPGHYASWDDYHTGSESQDVLCLTSPVFESLSEHKTFIVTLDYSFYATPSTMWSSFQLAIRNGDQQKAFAYLRSQNIAQSGDEHPTQACVSYQVQDVVGLDRFALEFIVDDTGAGDSKLGYGSIDNVYVIAAGARPPPLPPSSPSPVSPAPSTPTSPPSTPASPDAPAPVPASAPPPASLTPAVETSSSSWGTAAAVVVPLLLVAVAVSLGLFGYRRWRARRTVGSSRFAEVNFHQLLDDDDLLLRSNEMRVDEHP